MSVFGANQKRTDLSDLEYSDAGESGWTMYLDHSSSVSLHHFDDDNGVTKQEHDEDSSMVSDASSGPPYYSEEAVPEDPFQQNTQYWCKSKIKNKKKVHGEQGYTERFNSCLDDTASSLGKYKSGFLQQASPVEKFASDHQGYGASNQIKRRG
ncbi:protein SOB FIVE-LIKE 6 isoform X2 [Raphanus sativus]|uniref:Protein SOB FIVE-LIKE 6 isoform X2 n=1 Tax=Raphanus sativus TaxID=3726 RepID=A0A9W3CD95_RAPSA|nr:protein SOB FIVE-LIKE 6 isoform X2 [Raphanus sativus]